MEIALVAILVSAILGPAEYIRHRMLRAVRRLTGDGDDSCG